MISSLRPLLSKAIGGRYAIPAFNITNLETAQAVLMAAQDMKSPIIVQTSESAVAYAGHATILALMESAAQEFAPDVPVVTHLDHGKHFATIKKSINLGFRSVHMDASERPWSQNVTQTRKAVLLGHKKGVTVQGELGCLLGFEGMTKIKFDRKKLTELMTDPDQAQGFVKKTRVDTLAVAVGTAHGSFKGKEKIDFARLEAIHRKVRVPLVLHGGSGVSDAEIRRAIASGIRIINLDTSLRLHFLSGLKIGMKSYDPKAKVDIRPITTNARLTMKREAIRLIKLLRSARRA